MLCVCENNLYFVCLCNMHMHICEYMSMSHAAEEFSGVGIPSIIMIFPTILFLSLLSSFWVNIVFLLLSQFGLKKSGVQVFQQSSHGENMLLEIIAAEDSEELVSIQLSQTCFVEIILFVVWISVCSLRVLCYLYYTTLIIN